MRKFCVHVEGFEPYGLFIGLMLQEQRENLTSARKCQKIRESVEFYNLVSEKLADFFTLYEYNRQNIEKYFSR